jgi:hypothetical protein
MKLLIIGILTLLPLLSFASEDSQTTREIGNRILKSLEKKGSAFECVEARKVKSKEDFSNSIHGYVAGLGEDDDMKSVFMEVDKKDPESLCFRASLEVLDMEI